jgi:hypothetical protein
MKVEITTEEYIAVLQRRIIRASRGRSTNNDVEQVDAYLRRMRDKVIDLKSIQLEQEL